jgi:hypothetical protein
MKSKNACNLSLTGKIDRTTFQFTLYCTILCLILSLSDSAFARNQEVGIPVPPIIASVDESDYTVYYVDCYQGRDFNNGLSEKTPYS